MSRGAAGTGDAIRAARAWAGMSAANLAAELGVNIRQVQRWENGEQAGWTKSDLDWIAKRTGCPRGFLDRGWGTPDPTVRRGPRA